MKQIILDILDFWKFQVENGKCTEEQMKRIHSVASKELNVQATIDDIAEFYGQSRSNVSNVISRRPVPKSKRPQRRVMYDLGWFASQVPESWRRKH